MDVLIYYFVYAVINCKAECLYYSDSEKLRMISG